MALTRIDSYLVDLDSLGGITFDDQSGTPTFYVDAIEHRVGIGTSTPSQKLDLYGNARFSGKIIVGNELNNENISNVLNLEASTGADAFRPINLIDTSGSIKVARITDSETDDVAYEMQTWDSTITTQTSYWDIYGGENGMALRDRYTTPASRRQNKVYISPDGPVFIGSEKYDGPSSRAETAINGNTNVLQAQGNTYIYGKDSPNSFTEQILTASDGATGDNFGYSAAIGAGYVVSGAPIDNSSTGAIYIDSYLRNGITQIKVTASDAAAGDKLGWSVDIGDNKIVVGAVGKDSSAGGAYIYDFDGTNEVILEASDRVAGDSFGVSVAIGEDKVVVGALNEDTTPNSNQGAAYIYDQDGTNEIKLIPSDAASGDEFGISAAIDNGKVIIGARYADVNGNSGAGAVYTFNLDGTGEAKITPSDGAAGDIFGYSVAAHNGKIVVGAIGYNTSQGKAYIYNTDGTNEIILTAPDGAVGDRFGYKVDVFDGRVIVGAYKDDSDTGAAYLYKTDGTYITKLVASDATAGDLLGRDVGLSAGMAITTAADASSGAGATYTYDLIQDTGRVGIGTTDPKASLHIYRQDTRSSPTSVETHTDFILENPGRGNARFFLKTATNNRNWEFFADDGDGAFGVYDGIAVARRFTILPDGNVGIGATNPTVKLDIYRATDTSASTTGTTLVNLRNYVGNDLQQQKTFIDFIFTDDNDNETPQVRFGAELGQNGNADTQAKEGSGAFVVYTNNADSAGPGDAGASLKERLRVDYLGNVGIGYLDATNTNARTIDSKLDVFGGQLDDTVVNNRNSSARFTSAVGNNQLNLDILSRAHSNESLIEWGNTETRIEYNVDNNPQKRSWISFYNNTTQLTTDNMIRFGEYENSEWMRIHSDNLGVLRVGIGSNDPDTLLHIKGDTPKLRIESSNKLEASAGTEEIGRIEWEGVKNTNYNVAASIRVRQDGTWSTVTPWYSPTAIEFYTQDQSGIEETTPRLTISNSGYFNFRAKNTEYGGIALVNERVATVSAGSFVAGVSYVIKILGDTDWNAAAGTSGVTYALGDSFTAANAGSGTGAADGGSINNVNFIDFRNEFNMPTGHIFCNQETTNGSNLRFAVTPASTASNARTTDRRTEALRLLSDRSYSLQHDHSSSNGKIGMIKKGYAESSYYKEITINPKASNNAPHEYYLFTIPTGVTTLKIYTGGTYAEEGLVLKIQKHWGSASVPTIVEYSGSHHVECRLHYATSGNEQCDIFLSYQYDFGAPTNAVNTIRILAISQASLGNDTTRGTYEKSSAPTIPTLNDSNLIRYGLLSTALSSNAAPAVSIGSKNPIDTLLSQKTFTVHGVNYEELFGVKRYDVDDPYSSGAKELFRVSDDTGSPVLTASDTGFIRVQDPDNIRPDGRNGGGGILFGSDADVIGLYRDASTNLILRQGYSSPANLVLAGAGNVLVSLDVNANDVNTKAFIIGKNAYTSYVGETWEADTSSPAYQPAVEIARFRESGGLCFNGDIGDVNALNDYEEGNYNTTITADPGISITYLNRLLAYTKIGNLVHVTGRLYFEMSSNGNQVTDAGVTFRFTLPFYAANASTDGTRYETSNVMQVIRATSGAAPGAGARIFRILNGNNNVRMESDSGSPIGEFGNYRPHINVNLTYMTDS